MGGRARYWPSGLAGALALAVVALAHAPNAAAAERVTDGGFGATTCAPACLNPNWTKTGSAPALFCRSPGCPPIDGAPANGSAWVRLGGGGASATAAIEQAIAIPAGPATLSYKIGRLNLVTTATATVTAFIDGVQVSTRDRGKLSPAGPCATSEKVTVFRRKPGKDPRVGNDRTDARGKFIVGSWRASRAFSDLLNVGLSADGR